MANSTLLCSGFRDTVESYIKAMLPFHLVDRMALDSGPAIKLKGNKVLFLVIANLPSLPLPPFIPLIKQVYYPKSSLYYFFPIYADVGSENMSRLSQHDNNQKKITYGYLCVWL